ncbi:hypothetical protein GCM10010431_29490 [Streptomyces kunmingensis]
MVLAVDGPPGVTSPSGFGDLVPLLDVPHAIWRARPTISRVPYGPGLDAYVAPWIDEVLSTGLRVEAVLGSGVGGIFAGVIAQALTNRQQQPDVLLFDPELVDTGSVVEEFQRVLGEFSRPLDGDELWALEREVAAATDLCDDVASLAARLCAALAAVPEVSVADLELATLRFTALALAEPVDVLPLWSGRTALCSSSQDRGLNRTRNALLLPEAALVHREISFADDHAGVFKSSDVACTASALLAAHAA